MSKCIGCGIRLQYDNPKEPGYTPKKDSKLCQRCFKITNYNENSITTIVRKDDDIILSINKKKCYTFFFVDLYNLNIKTIDLYNKITNEKSLVITKIDTLPKNLDFNILAKNIKKIYDVKDVYFFSKVSGYGKNNLLNIIESKKKVIFSGPTSSGKSSCINYLFEKNLTVSNYKNTTSDFISINVGSTQVIDAPGFNEMYNASEYIIKKKINPKTILLKKGYVLMINDYVISSEKDINLSLYFLENVQIKTKKAIMDSKKMSIKKQNDLVLYSLGFIYFKNDANIMINKKKDVEIRESIVVNNE